MAVMSALLAGCPLPPGRVLVFISVRGWVDPRAIVRLEGLGQLKSAMTSSGIEPTTFRLVAKGLDHAIAILLQTKYLVHEICLFVIKMRTSDTSTYKQWTVPIRG
jgi:hypothetical protein